MAIKVLLTSVDKTGTTTNILPITRGELVLDSSGEVALHSEEFLASDNKPGLMKYTVTPTKSADIKIAQLETKVNNTPIYLYPKTISDAVSVTITGKNKQSEIVTKDSSLSEVLTLDQKPTAGNYTSLVSSGGVYDELKETVGNIQILLQNV